MRYHSALIEEPNKCHPLFATIAQTGQVFDFHHRSADLFLSHDPSTHAQGAMDDFRLYGRAMADDEIWTLHSMKIQ